MHLGAGSRVGGRRSTEVLLLCRGVRITRAVKLYSRGLVIGIKGGRRYTNRNTNTHLRQKTQTFVGTQVLESGSGGIQLLNPTDLAVLRGVRGEGRLDTIRSNGVIGDSEVKY